MKNLHLKEVIELTELVFISFDHGENFQLLTTSKGKTFTCIHNAIEHVRTSELTHLCHVGLSKFKHAQLGDCEWDNI